MSELKKDLREKEWADEIPDEEDERPEAYEETYRDGSAKNECWNAGKRFASGVTREELKAWAEDVLRA